MISWGPPFLEACQTVSAARPEGTGALKDQLLLQALPTLLATISPTPRSLLFLLGCLEVQWSPPPPPAFLGTVAAPSPWLSSWSPLLPLGFQSARFCSCLGAPCPPGPLDADAPGWGAG